MHTALFPGQVIVGRVQSLTVTSKLQVARLPAVSETVQLTVVVPRLNVDPLGGVQLGMSAPSQLSKAVTV